MKKSLNEAGFDWKKIIMTSIIVIILIFSFQFSYSSYINDFKNIAMTKESLLEEYINLSSNFINDAAIYGNLFFEQEGSKDSELYALLKYNPETDSYSLDAAEGTEYAKSVGNLTGTGSIPQNGAEKDELNLALQYNHFFHSFFLKLPEVAWLYYTSENNFINIYPWTPSRDFAFSDKLKTVEFYTIAEPQNNPERKSAWTSVYTDEAGKGLMVTLSAPVYDGDAFRGVVSLDLTNSELGAIIDSEYDSYLIDDTDTVLAAKDLSGKSIMKIDDLMHVSETEIGKMEALKTGIVSYINRYYVYSAVFDDAPWRLFYRVPVWLIACKSALSVIPILLISILFIWATRQIDRRKKSEALLHKERELIKTTLFSVNEGIIVTDVSGSITMMNKIAEKYTGWMEAEAIGQDFHMVFNNIDIVTGEKRQDPVRYVLETGKSISSEKNVKLLARDGSENYILSSAAGIFSDDEKMTGVVFSFRDISLEYEQEKEIEGFLNSNLDILCIFDAAGNYQRVNKKFEEVFGYTTEEVKGRNYLFLVHDDDVETTRNFIKELNKERIVIGFMNKCISKDGSYRYIEWNAQSGNSEYFYASARDVTEKVMTEKKLETFAVRDQLTGVYNRNYLDMIVAREMDMADRNKFPLSMVLLDLDHFKDVNDTWGHPVGDEQLKLTAQTTGASIRSSDILVRFGGEEFIVLLPKTHLNGAVAAAEKIRKAIEKNNHPITGRQTASFGVAERIKGESFAHWYQRLDEALYNAKASGRNRVISANFNEKQGIVSVHIEWKKEWESGYKEIDEQHRELIECANGLIHMSFANEGFDKARNQLELLIDSCLKHFAFEEQLITRAGYPAYKEHAKIHKDLLNKAFIIQDLFQRGELKPSALLSFIVDDIILLHMEKEDVKFIPYIEKYEGK